MNKKRILCLGDSATAGYPYEEKPAHTYPAQLQRWLGRTSKDFEVVNAGVDGLTALQLEAMLSELLETHQPDIVVLMIGGNDMLQHICTRISVVQGRSSRWVLSDECSVWPIASSRSKRKKETLLN